MKKLTLPKINKKKLMAKVAKTLTLALTSATLVLFALIAVNNFFQKRYFAFHTPIVVKFHAPITIEERTPLLSPVATQSSVLRTDVKAVEGTSIPDEESRTHYLYKHIHAKESNSGKAPQGLHTTCRAKGMANEWGYLPKPGYCFPTFEQGVITVKTWIGKRINLGWSDAEILCYYNQGIKTNNCSYARK